MPTEIIHPTPLWQRGFYHAEWSHARTGYNSARMVFPGLVAYTGVMTAIYAYAERRCLYIYQKHDPRAVYLPWEKQFVAAHHH